MTPVDEQVVPIEVFEQARRFIVVAERDGFGARDGRWNRAHHQHVLVFRPCAVEDLACEVLEDRVLALAQGFVDRGAASAQVLAQQHEGGHPAVAFPLDAQELLAIDRLAAEDGLRFVLGAAKLRFVDAGDAPARDLPRELGRWIGARDHDDRDALGHFLQSLRERRPLLGRGVGFVKVVEDDDAGTGQHREKIAAEAADEPCEVLLGLRGEVGQGRRRLAGQLLGGDAQVVHERRGVGVASVELVPDVTPAARLQIARHERGLAGARCGADPRYRSRQGFVEAREQPGTRQRVVELGPGELGEGRAGCHVADGYARRG
jgi:hypothetical protein